MTPQEKDMLNGLIDRVNHTQPQDKDSEAEQLLQNTLGRNPNALYVLAQTVLVQGYALEQAQKQLADARQQMEQLRQTSSQPQKHTSFLGSIFGSSEPDRPSPPPPPPPAQSTGYSPVPAQQGYSPVPTQQGYNPGPAQGYAAAPVMGGSQGGGFLRGAMQTATGVAAGALAFEGVESLMHGFGHGGGGYGMDSGMGGGRPEEVVNNYYGDSGPGRDDSRGFSDAGNSGDNNPGDNMFTDNQDSNQDSNDLQANSGDDQDTSGFDDNSSSMDDSSFDDGSSMGGDDSSF